MGWQTSQIEAEEKMKIPFIRNWSALWAAAGLAIGAILPSIAQPLAEGNLECTSIVRWHSNCGQPSFDLDARRGQAGVRAAS